MKRGTWRTRKKAQMGPTVLWTECAKSGNLSLVFYIREIYRMREHFNAVWRTARLCAILTSGLRADGCRDLWEKVNMHHISSTLINLRPTSEMDVKMGVLPKFRNTSACVGWLFIRFTVEKDDLQAQKLWAYPIICSSLASLFRRRILPLEKWGSCREDRR